MASEKKNALNLDELFGQSKAVIVIHNKRDYEFMRIEALGPRQAVQIQKLQKRAQVLQSIRGDITDAQSNEIETIFEQIITMLCPEFPVKEIEFAKKMHIVMFYMEETQGKKVMETALKKLTGQKRSRR
jgi:hypothetical protein